MAVRMAEIEAVITADTSDFDSGVSGASSNLDSFSSKLDAAGGKMQQVGGIMSVAVTAPLVAFGVGAVNAASDVQEAQSAVNTVYGESAGIINDFAGDAAQNLGITEGAALSAAGRLGALGSSLGIQGEELGDFSISTLEAASDLGSFYNVEPGDALNALRSGLIGEAEPLRQFGILLDADTVKQRALEMGLADATGEVSQQGLVMARHAIIMEQLGDAEGDFARTSDGLANSQRILGATMGDLSAELGTVLLPYVQQGVAFVQNLVTSFSGLDSGTKSLIVGIGTAAAAVGPLLIVFGALIKQASTVASVLTKLPLALGPLGLILAAGAAAIYAYQNNLFGFADAVNGVLGVLQSFINYIRLVITDGDVLNDWLTHLPGFLQPIALAFAGVITTIQQLTESFQGFQAQGLDPLHAGFSALATVFPGLIGVLSPLLSLIDNAVVTVQRLHASFTAFVAQGFTPLQAAFEALRDVFPTFTGAIDVAEAIVTSFIGTLQGIGTGLLDALTALSQGDIAGVLQGLFDAAMAAITGFIDLAIIAWGGLFQGLAAIDWSAVSAAIQSGLQAISDALATWLSERSTQLQTGMKVAWDAIAAQIPGAWSVIQAAISGAWAVIQETVSTALIAIQQIVTDAWIAVETAIAGPLETAKATVLAAWTAIQETVALAMQTVTETVSTTWTAIQDTIATAQETIASAITTAWLAINDFIGTAVQTILSTVQTAFDAITTAITTAATEAKDGFLSTLSTMKDEAITTLTGIKDGIVALFADARSWLLQAGIDIIGGMIDGILSMAGQVGDAVASVIPDEISVGMPTLDFIGGGGGGGEPSGGGGGGPSRRRALGGPVSAGLAYWVGEGGAELFVPQSSGRVLSHQDSMAAAGGGGGSQQVFIENLNLPGVRDPQDFLDAMRDLTRMNGVAAGRGVG